MLINSSLLKCLEKWSDQMIDRRELIVSWKLCADLAMQSEVLDCKLIFFCGVLEIIG